MEGEGDQNERARPSHPHPGPGPKPPCPCDGARPARERTRGQCPVLGTAITSTSLSPCSPLPAGAREEGPEGGLPEG